MPHFVARQPAWEVRTAILFFGIPDDSFQTSHNTYGGVSAQQQTTEKWHNQVQFSYAQFDSTFENPSPTGEPFDPFGFGPNYLGKNVTIRGANGLASRVRQFSISDRHRPTPSNFPTTRPAVPSMPNPTINSSKTGPGSLDFATSMKMAKDYA